MSNLKTNKQKILKVLAKENLNSSTISEKLNIQIESVCVYLNALLNADKIERITDKKPYLYRAKNSLRYLKDLYDFMSNEQKCELNEINESDIEFLNKIKELIK